MAKFKIQGSDVCSVSLLQEGDSVVLMVDGVDVAVLDGSDGYLYVYKENLGAAGIEGLEVATDEDEPEEGI